MSPQTLIPTKSRTAKAKAGRGQDSATQREASGGKRRGDAGRDTASLVGTSMSVGRIRLRGRRGAR